MIGQAKTLEQYFNTSAGIPLRPVAFVSSRLARATYTSASVIEMLSKLIGGVAGELESGGGILLDLNTD